jgi:hypothetical protein
MRVIHKRFAALEEFMKLAQMSVFVAHD